MSKVLMIGNGGREHAMAWKIAQHDEVETVYFIGDNAGMEQENKLEKVDVALNPSKEYLELADFIEKKSIDMVVVGPEQPLVDGIVDSLNKKGYDGIFGPTSKNAELESDKFFSDTINQELNIPQAVSIQCYNIDMATNAVRELISDDGIVIKARGLAAGKGVIVCNDEQEAYAGMDLISKTYGQHMLVSQRLFGQEFSVFALTDGITVLPLNIAIKDHKRQLDGNRGPNTGGMGAYGPANVGDPVTLEIITKDILEPIVKTLGNRNGVYEGFLYACMMMTEDGPKVIEYNVRFGDPEAQVAMMLIDDLYTPIKLALEGRLHDALIKENSGCACCVVLASKGYPDDYKINKEIKGLDSPSKVEISKIFHAGTRYDNGKIVTNGGRVLGVTSMRLSLHEAKTHATLMAKKISDQNPGIFQYRTDIAA